MRHRRAQSSAEDREDTWTIVVAGGSGLRFGERKQFASLGQYSVLHHGVEAAKSVSSRVTVVVPADAVDHAATLLGDDEEVVLVAGGASRAESVRAGLATVPDNIEVVLVHDAARPLATAELFERVVDAVREGAAAVIPVVPVTDSIRHVDGNVVDRSSLLAVQTPQGFTGLALRQAHATESEATDDASLVGALGHEVTTVEGESDNRKITVQSDLVFTRAVLAARDAERKEHDVARNS